MLPCPAKTSRSVWRPQVLGALVLQDGLDVKSHRNDELADWRLALNVAAADLAYSYKCSLERLKADGTKDTLPSLEVFQDQRSLVSGEFELAIGSSSIGGPGRYAVIGYCHNNWAMQESTVVTCLPDTAWPLHTRVHLNTDVQVQAGLSFSCALV